MPLNTAAPVLLRPFDPDAADYFARVVAAGGSIDALTQRAVNRFVRDLKTAGVWDLIDLLWPCAGADLTSALVLLKRPSGVASSLTNVNFVAGDYGANGLTGNGSNKRLTITSFNPSTYQTGASFHLAVYRTRVNSWGTGIEIGGFSPTNYYLQSAVANFAVSNAVALMNGTVNAVWDGDPCALIHANTITSGTAGAVYKGGVSVGSATITSGSVLTSVGLFAAASGFFFSPNTLAGASVGGGMTAAQAAAYSAAWETFIAALGRRPIEPPVDFNVEGLVSTGQSLAEGAGGQASPTTTAVTRGVMLLSGATSRISSDTRLRGLVGGASPDTGGNFGWEPPAIGAIENLNDLYTTTTFLTCGSPLGGSALSSRSKNTTTYNLTLSQVTAANAAAVSRSKTFRVGAILHTDGENDDLSYNASFSTQLATFHTDIETDIKAITGQTGTIPIVFSQAHCWPNYLSPTRSTPTAAPLQLSFYLGDTTKRLLACPKYMLPYVDTAHLTGPGSRWLGEYYAKAYWSYLNGGWTPLYPLSVTRSGATITAVMSKGGLVIDTTLVSSYDGTAAGRKHGTAASSASDTTVTLYRGFEFVDDNASSPSASVTGITVGTTNVTDDTLTITLSGTPTGTNKRLRYAWTRAVGSNPGPTTGVRGNLRDSDTSFASVYGNTLYNWCLTFDMDAS